jgi:outer membrane protein assembly factor BamB
MPLRFSFLLLFTALPLAAQDAPWATYRGNAQRTGNTDNVPGPKTAPALLWAMKSGSHFVASPVPANDQVIFSAIGALNRPEVLSLAMTPKDPASVQPTWTKSLPLIRLPTVSSPAVADGKIIFGDGMHQTDGAVLYCLPADGSTLLWALSVPGELVHMEGSPAVANGKVYVGGGSAGVICVDLNTVTLDGKELNVKDVPALQAEHMRKLRAAYEQEKKKDPDFAVAPGDDKLLKPAPKAVWTQGQKRWHVDAPILVAGGKVLAASAFLDKEKLGERALFCLDASTGKELWKAPLTYNPWSGPTLAGDTVIVTTSSISYDPKLIEGARGEVIAIDLASGKEKWKKAIPAGVLGCAAVTKDAAVFTATDGRLRAFSLKDGSRLAIYDARDCFFAPPAVVGDVAYAADCKGVVHAVDLKTGAALWTFDLGKDPLKSPGMNYGGVTVHGGKLYLATCNIEGPFARQPTVVVCLGSK